MNVLAIDPGGTTGMAVINLVTGEFKGWQVEGGAVPAIVASLVRGEQGRVDVVVVEKFVGYPWEIEALLWSEFPESQLIGAIKWICKSAEPEVRCVEQGADIKNTAEKILEKMGMKLLAKGRHARDAELHLRYWCAKNRAELRQKAGDELAGVVDLSKRRGAEGAEGVGG